MVKVPRPGRVKTRLGRDIGMTTAAWWFRHQTKALIRRLRDPRWQIVLAVTPDHEGLQFRAWPPDIERTPQGTGDLGARMARVLRSTPGPTVLIGADIPGITRVHIARAFQALGSSPSAIGPATDGGYWCVEHGIPEEACSMCSSKAADDFKAKGDWCEEHSRAESQCFKCDPSRAEKYAKLYEAKFGHAPPQPTE